MELKGNDKVIIQVDDYLSIADQKSLLSLYQPIMGANATLLYLTLINEGNIYKSEIAHEMICEIMNINIMDLEKARYTLEEFGLLQTMYKQDVNYDRYIYIVNKPLKPNDFIKKDEFLKLLMKSLDNKKFELLLSQILCNYVNKGDYVDVSKELSLDESRYQKLDELKLNIVKPNYGFTKHKDYEFDFDLFFKKTSALIFPLELRNEENLSLIGKMADLYGISVDQMKIFVGDCVDIKTMQFNRTLFRNKVSKVNNDTLNKEDVYMSNPVAFLSNKQNGIKVTGADKVLLEHLAVDLNLNNEVINVLIEYVLRINDNSIPFNFVEKIAAEWVRNNITTKQEAIKATSKSMKQRRSYPSKRVVPQYRKSESDSGKSREELLKELKEGLSRE